MGLAPKALIDHAALRHNLQRVRNAAPQSRVWSVIKANAYGHGMQRAAQALQESDGFAVARLDEGVKLRQSGFHQPILVMSGCYSQEDWLAAIENGFDVAVHQSRQIDLLESLTHSQAAVDVWLKIDSGMHRLGIRPDQAPEMAARLSAHPAVREINLMTHLANGDDRSDSYTEHQISCFDAIDANAFSQRSVANSAGVLGFPASHREWVRPGIMLYGVSPFIDATAEALGLAPVMTFSSQVISVQQCRKGDPIGYGGIYRCPEDMPVAVIAAGYGDGYPRHAGEGTPVLLGDRRLPLAGRVSMDMITVDARDYPQVAVGDPVVLWGPGLPVEEIARSSGTIGYELLCGITSRVEYVDLNRVNKGQG
jgi:alanine racemase